MNIKTIFFLCLIYFGCSSSTLARPYLGASAGITKVDVAGYQVGITQKLTAGLRNLDAGLELSYINLGDFKPDNGGGTIKGNGISLTIMPYFPINRTFEMFGKLGGFAWNLSLPTGDTTFINNDGFSYTVGFGANVNLVHHFTLRMELEKFYNIGSTGDGNLGSGLTTVTAGVIFLF